ncbi:esterase [Pigmentiphaga soli]|uniref:Esterase n=1 Tax=Pigmentiphaga soli TaxID=1007095 RepID=A0ABP8H2E0_9BURK
MTADAETPSVGEAGPGRAGPIALREMGSFHVGGRVVRLEGQPAAEYLMAEGGQPVRIDPNGSYFVEQMYAQYFFVQDEGGHWPLLFWHGGGMSGATWETTPDGRSGWLHYFLRRGWDAYLCDAVERGRSGFAPVPQVWPQGPVIQPAESIHGRFRIDYPDTQFPREHFDRLARQMVPRWTHTDGAIMAAYLELLERTGPAIVVCHSQSGVFALRAAHARPDLVRAVVALEPASVPAFDPAVPYRAPTLVLMGDHIDEDPRWPRMRDRIQAFAAQWPQVEVVPLPARGMKGNSHMLMMDRNSLEIADLAHDWLAALPAARRAD